MTDPITDQQAERMADAYNLGIKAEGLREFATDLEGVPHYPAAILARKKAEALDALAEELATTAEPAPPAELTEAQRLAEQIILSAADEAADWGGIGEQLEDDYGHLSPDEFDQKRKEIYELIVAAKVTPSWPEPTTTPEQDGGQAEGGL